MGMTRVQMRVRQHRKAPDHADLEFLVDSGAAFTVAPGDVLERLGIEADSEQEFRFANGEKVIRKVGDAYFEFQRKGGYSKVIFGEGGDSNLLGVLTLETFGLVLDPFKRELKPLPMLLM